MFKAFIGHSNDPDSAMAISEVLEECKHSLEGQIPQAGILFTAIDYDHASILEQIRQAFPGIELIGGTTNGELSSVLQFQQDSLTLMLFVADRIKIRAGVGYNASNNPNQAARDAIAQARAKSNDSPKLCLTFPESLTCSGAEILQGLQESLGDKIPIVGGGTADDNTLDQTYQFFGDRVLSDAIPVLLFFGDLVVSHGVASGWEPITPKSVVTKAQSNVVYEIEGQRALDFYQKYLSKDRFVTGHMTHPLAVVEEERYYMRSLSSYDPESGSVSFFADIPDRATVQITYASRENVLAASAASLQDALSNYPGEQPTAALLVSCSARRRLLGTLASQEYALIENHLPQGLPCCGFYAYGEIAPLKQQSQTKFHNQTFVTLLIGES